MKFFPLWNVQKILHAAELRYLPCATKGSLSCLYQAARITGSPRLTTLIRSLDAV